MSKYRDVENLINIFRGAEKTSEGLKETFAMLAEVLENAPTKGADTIVETGDILIRDGKSYEVVIADDNIFVVCLMDYDETEGSEITHYDAPEIYANQRSINTLEDLHFTKEGRGR